MKEFFTKLWTQITTAFKTHAWLKWVAIGVAAILVGVIVAVASLGGSPSSGGNGSGDSSSSSQPTQSSSSSSEEDSSSSEIEVEPKVLYSLSDDSTYAIVSGFEGAPVDVVIESTYEGKPVQVIGNNAFELCRSLKSVIIPEGVIIIDYNAFQHCNHLESVVIPEGVTTIKGSAFFNCTSLETVSLPDSLTYIDRSAFMNCDLEFAQNGSSKYLGNENNPYMVMMFAEGALIHENTKIIASNAFYGQRNMRRVIIPTSVISICDSVFQYCESLETIEYEGTVEQWNAIQKAENWKYNAPATQVVCIDGNVEI